MYALVDCNNFFVSCERVFSPQLEGKPVVVLSNNDGCVVARSNESKAMGISMCAPFYKIKHLADAGKLYVRSSNYALYGDLSSRVMSILAESVPKMEIYSIDEAFLVMDGIDDKEIMRICKDLVIKIRKWTGIPVSIGVAKTKTLAKIASHFAKRYRGYRGVCIIDTDEKRDKALSLTPIDDVWGIGRRLSAEMKKYGVLTACDFVQRPRQWIKDRFMLPGLRTCNELVGIPCVAEELPEKRKSICTSRSFADMIEDADELSSKVADFASQCAGKLRKENTAAYRVTVFLRTNPFREELGQYNPDVSIRLQVAANSSQEIVSTAIRGMKLIYREGFLYKKAGVIVDDIIEADSVQTAMFGFDAEQRKKHDILSSVMDNIGGLRLASQSESGFSKGIRSEFRSGNFTTDFNEIINVK